jgi:HAE1 family hydrophobic/amphiphilic exporter-1
VSSTLLTLVLVPTLYTMAEDTKLKARTRRERRRARKAVADGGDGAAPEAASPRHAGQPARQRSAAEATGGGAHAAPEDEPAVAPAEAQSAALRGYTDQFEVLKMPKHPTPPPPA